MTVVYLLKKKTEDGWEVIERNPDWKVLEHNRSQLKGEFIIVAKLED